MPQANISPAEAESLMRKRIDEAIAAKTKSLTALVDKLEPFIPALEKAAQTAASRAGISPEQLFSKMAADMTTGLPGYALTSNGDVVPLGARSRVRKTKSIGTRVNKGQTAGHFGEAGNKSSFGEFLHHNYRIGQLGVGRAGDSLEALHKMGAYATRTGDDGMVIKTALAESSGITGGYGVPPQFLEEMQRLSIEEQILGARARKLPMTTATLTIPSLDHTTVYGAGVTPFLGGVQGQWASEAGLIAESEPQMRQTELRANQLSLFMVVSNVLMQDQVVNLDALITELLTDADAWYSDLAYIRGNGAGQPLGVQNCAATIQVTRQTSGHVTFQDVRAMFARQIYNNMDDLIWVGHPSIVDDILGMNDQQGGTTGIGVGRLVWQPFNQGAQADIPRPAGKQSFGKLLGIDFFLSEKMQSKGNLGDLMLVDAGKYLLGERLDAQIESSPHPYFKTYQTVIRCVARKDGQPWLNSAVTLADGSFTQSPFTILH